MRPLLSSLFQSTFKLRLDPLAAKRWIHSGQMMTTQEVATALRPFIFVVHPDRFWNHPKEKSTNEVSLKKLNEFLGDKLSQRVFANEQTITFYVRDNQSGGTTSITTPSRRATQVELKKVDIRLNSRENINTTVHRILSQCSLSTDYLQQIGKEPKKNTSNSTSGDGLNSFYRRGNEYFYSKELFDEFENRFVCKSKVELTFPEWLKENYESALKKLEASQPIRSELTRLRQELINQLGLNDLRWNCDWSVSHIRGCLKNLDVLCKQYPDDMRYLNKKTVVFSRHNGISFDGQVVLSIEEVRNSWLDLIRSIPTYDIYVNSLPMAEEVLSDLLNGISIVHPEYNLWNAKKYFKQLERLTKSVKEFKTENGLPDLWPNSLAEYRLIVEFDSGPLMLSTSGDFIVPASCPVSLLVRFISENLHKASRILQTGGVNLEQERRAMEQVVTTFDLDCLDKDENITSTQMVDFCRRLLHQEDQLGPYLKGTHLRVSMYYSVLHDGQICVPFNFVA